MARKITYWISTSLISVFLLMALSYLGGSEEVVSGFAKAGWPQLLRIALGIAKPLAAIVLIVPGIALVKEWAYACVGVTWIMAFLSAYATGEAATIWAMPIGLLALMVPALLPPPAPFKLFVLAAGLANVRPLAFVTAIAVARGARYFALGLLAMYFGDAALELMRTRGAEVAMWLVAAIVVAVAAWWAWSRWRPAGETA